MATLFEGTFHQLVVGSLGDAMRAWRAKGAAELRYVAASLRKEFAARKALTDEERAEWKNAYDEYGAVVKMAADAGVTIVTGSDIAAERVPGFTLHDELELLVTAGLTPLQVLRAATVNSAAVANEVAAIEPGTRADLVLLDADPLADIRNTRKIHAVITRGKLLLRPDLDRLLAEGEALAAVR